MVHIIYVTTELNELQTEVEMVIFIGNVAKKGVRLVIHQKDIITKMVYVKNVTTVLKMDSLTVSLSTLKVIVMKVYILLQNN